MCETLQAVASYIKGQHSVLFYWLFPTISFQEHHCSQYMKFLHLYDRSRDDTKILQAEVSKSLHLKWRCIINSVIIEIICFYWLKYTLWFSFSRMYIYICLYLPIYLQWSKKQGTMLRSSYARKRQYWGCLDI